jgi:hypothetical protein
MYSVETQQPTYRDVIINMKHCNKSPNTNRDSDQSHTEDYGKTDFLTTRSQKAL